MAHFMGSCENKTYNHRSYKIRKNKLRSVARKGALSHTREKKLYHEKEAVSRERGCFRRKRFMASEERDFVTRQRLCHEKRLCPMKEAKSGEKTV